MFSFDKNNALKILQFNKYSLIPFMRYLFLRYLFVCPVNGLKNVCVGIKLSNLLKSRLCFKERWKISRVNNSKTKNMFA